MERRSGRLVGARRRDDRVRGRRDGGFQDPTCVADGSDVWISYGLPAPLPVDGLPLLDAVRVAHSIDDGASIASRTDAHDGAAPLQLLPQLVFDGSLHVVYHAGTAEGDPLGTLRWTRSIDDGATWSPSESLDCPQTFTGKRTVPTWMGDYVGVTSAGGALHVSYVDNTSGFSHVAALHLPVP